ncbi:MAG: hypothetical protein R6V35_01520 [Candidatus Nanohaloarchaea archaeon]
MAIIDYLSTYLEGSALYKITAGTFALGGTAIYIGLTGTLLEEFQYASIIRGFSVLLGIGSLTASFKLHQLRSDWADEHEEVAKDIRRRRNDRD